MARVKVTTDFYLQSAGTLEVGSLRFNAVGFIATQVRRRRLASAVPVREIHAVSSRSSCKSGFSVQFVELSSGSWSATVGKVRRKHKLAPFIRPHQQPGKGLPDSSDLIRQHGMPGQGLPITNESCFYRDKQGIKGLAAPLCRRPPSTTEMRSLAIRRSKAVTWA